LNKIRDHESGGKSIKRIEWTPWQQEKSNSTLATLAGLFTFAVP
jgi:hypothetical protein